MRARAQTGPARLLDSCQGRQQRSRTSSHSRGLLRTHPARAARRRNVRATTPRESPHHRLAALDAGAEVPFLGSRRIIVAAVAAGRRGPNASRVAALRPKHPYKSTTEGGRLRMHRKRCDRYDHPTSWSSARAPQVGSRSARQTRAGRCTPDHGCSKLNRRYHNNPLAVSKQARAKNAAKNAADSPFKPNHQLNAVEPWPPAPQGARGSCPTSTWARPSSSS